MSSPRYLLQLSAAVLATLLIVAAINWAIDPLAWRFGSRFDLYSGNDRAVKAHWIRKYSHDGLLIGSSKVKRINPETIKSPRLFNAAFDAARPEVIFEFLTRYADHERLVVLGLDFWAMNHRAGTGLEEPVFVSLEMPPLHGKPLLQWVSYLFSLETLYYGVNILFKVASGVSGLIAPAGNQIFEPDVGARPRDAVIYPKILVEALRHYENFEYSESRVEVIKKIKAWADVRGIKLLAFLNPLNRDEANGLRNTPAWQVLPRFRRDMREIFPELHDFTDDFSDPKYYFAHDPFHYLPSTGTRILERVLAESKESPRPPQN